jgi:tetratricopeptide (TPR) repeat protein
MRVGVVTGEVAVNVGATGQGMVAGDAVNTAARVQAKASPGTVWVDAQTRALAGGSIDFADAGVHELKGKAEPIELFVATAVMGGVRGERSTDRIQAPLVGRRRELSVLKEMFHVAGEEGRPRLVIVSGDAGVGKTRLGWEFQNYIDGLSATVLWHRGRCLAYGEGVGFSALTGAVRGRIGATEDDDDATIRAKLARSLEEFVPDPAERARLSPALANLLGLGGASGMVREDLFGAWLTWFERLSQRHGEAVVLLVDDAQYADDGLLDFIEHLCTVASVGLLVVLLARPELLARRPTLPALRRANLIGLETLSRADTAELFDGLVEGLPASLRSALVDRVEGNPLFAIETVRAMLDQGLTVAGPTRRAGAVRLATGVDAEHLAALAAPASLHVLVMSRLDLLPARERAVLAAASVIGQTFTGGALAAVTRLPDDELAAAIRELLGRDLLTMVTDRLSAEEGQYAFVQAVVRSVAYQTQSKRDRLQRHLTVVDYLESGSVSDGGLSPVIAQHLRDAMAATGPDDPQRPALAIRLGNWLQRSAERSLALGAPNEARRAYVEALDYATDATDQIRLHIAAAEAAVAAAEHEFAAEYTLPIARGEVPAPAEDVANAAQLAAAALRYSGHIAEGWRVLEPYMQEGVVDELPPLIAARLAARIALYLTDTGRHDVASAWNERAMRWAEDAGEPRQIAYVLNNFASSLLWRGLTRVGMAMLDLSAEYARDHSIGSELGRSLVNKLAFGLNRDLDAALAAGEEAVAVCEQIGDAGVLWQAVINQAVALYRAGRWDECASLGDRPLLRQRPAARPQYSSIVLVSAQLAMARGEALDLAPIDDYAQDATAEADLNLQTMFAAALLAISAREHGQREMMTDTCRRLVETLDKISPLEDDYAHLWTLAVDLMIDERQLAVARDLIHLVAHVPAARLSPILAAELPRFRGTIEAGDPASSAGSDVIEQDLLTAIELLDEFGAVPDRARAQGVLGAWLMRQGRPVEAALHLDAARQTFADLQASAWLRELDHALRPAATG